MEPNGVASPRSRIRRIGDMVRSRAAQPWLHGWALAAGLTGTVGCGGGGDGLPRQAVQGSVSYAGKPVESGLIQFLPLDPAAPGAVAGGAPVLEGRYAIARDVGLVPGSYRVTIQATQVAPVSGAAEAPGAISPAPAELIPARYNTESTLRAEVKPGQSDPIDFNLAR